MEAIHIRDYFPAGDFFIVFFVTLNGMKHNLKVNKHQKSFGEMS